MFGGLLLISWPPHGLGSHCTPAAFIITHTLISQSSAHANLFNLMLVHLATSYLTGDASKELIGKIKSVYCYWLSSSAESVLGYRLLVFV